MLGFSNVPRTDTMQVMPGYAFVKNTFSFNEDVFFTKALPGMIFTMFCCRKARNITDLLGLAWTFLKNQELYSRR